MTNFSLHYKNIYNKLTSYHINNLRINTLIFNIIIFFLLNAIFHIYETGSISCVEKEIGLPSNDLPVHDETFQRQFGVYPVSDNKAFWGFGSPYNMEQAYDKNYGYFDWNKKNEVLMLTEVAKDVPPRLSNESEANNETAENADYNQMFYIKLVQELSGQVTEKLKTDFNPESPIDDFNLKHLIHNVVLESTIWGENPSTLNIHISTRATEVIQATTDLLDFLEKEEAKSPELNMIIQRIGVSVLIHMDMLGKQIPNDEYVLNDDLMYKSYCLEIYTNNEN